LAGEGGQGGQGRVLLRASGTEPLLRVMVEGQDAARVEEEAERLALAVSEALVDDAK
jgi:phosphoglucosamine mutase